jgi:hypothetical protein
MTLYEESSLYSKKFQVCIELIKSGHIADAKREFLLLKEPKNKGTTLLLYKKIKTILLDEENKCINNSKQADNIKNEPLEINTHEKTNLLATNYFKKLNGVTLKLSDMDDKLTNNGISIVTACMNRVDNLLKVMPSWLSKDVDEIIIVDWSSDEPILQKLKKFNDERIKVVRINDESNWVLTHAFNIGLKLAKFSVIYKMDCDIEVRENFFIRNSFKNGEFVRGYWKIAAERNGVDQKYINGTFGCRKSDLRNIGYYDERIQTYGWDDSDLYSRLSLDYGLIGKYIDPDSLRHIEQAEIDRTVKQKINNSLFLGKFNPSEFEGGVNKYLTINNTMWGDYFLSRDYDLECVEDNYIVGNAISQIERGKKDLISFAEILSSRQLILWNADSLKNISFETQQKISFSKLFRDAHHLNLSEMLLNSFKLNKNIHLILIDDKCLLPAVKKTIQIFHKYIERSKNTIFIIEELEDENFSREYLVASRELILELSESLEAIKLSKIKDLEHKIEGGSLKIDLTTLSLVSIYEESLDYKKRFENNLDGHYERPLNYRVDTYFITSLYDEFNLIRLIEYLAAFIINTDVFYKFIIFYESSNNILFDIIKIHIEKSNINRDRIHFIHFNLRPKFEDLFSTGKDVGENKVLVVANADICFDNSVNNIIDNINSDDFIVLSRRDFTSVGSQLNLIRLDHGCANTFSADAWLVKTPFNPDFRLDYEIGTIHCDSFINFQAGHSARYKISNPCLTTSIYHLHDDRFNTSEFKTINDKEKIEKKYGEEWVKCGNQDPVRGVSWSSINSSRLFQSSQKLQRWKPKTLVLDTSGIGFHIGALFLTHLFSNLLKKYDDVGVVIIIDKNEVDKSAELLISEYRHFFDSNLCIEIADVEHNQSLSRAKMCHTNKIDYQNLKVKIENLDYIGLQEFLQSHTQWPGIEGIKLVRGEIIINPSTSEHLKLFNIFKNKFKNEYETLIEFFNSLDKWNPAKQSIIPMRNAFTVDAEAICELNNRDVIPTVTFVTSLYKGGRYLSGYLENIAIAAEIASGEVIIIDANCDGSEADIIRNFINQKPNYKKIFTYIELNEDPGLYECWNMAISKAKASYITNANLDDRRDPYHTASLVNFLEQNSNYAAISGDIFAVEEKKIDNWFLIRNGQIWFNDAGDCEVNKNDLFIFEEDKLKSRNIMHCMPVWRKSLHDKYGYFDELNFGTSADWEFWLRVTAAGEILYHKKNIFGLYTIDENSHNRRDLKSLSKETNIVEKYIMKHKDN